MSAHVSQISPDHNGAQVIEPHSSFLQLSEPAQPSNIRIPGLNLISMEQFDAEMAARRAQKEQQKENKPVLDTKKAKPSSSAPAAGPILLPSKPKAEWMPKFNHLMQIHNLTSRVECEEETQQCFSATLTLLSGEEEIQTFSTEPQLFRSKKEAKDKVAEQGYLYLSIRPAAPKSTSTASTSAAGATSAVDRSENWVGLLNHFCQTSGVPSPALNEYQRGAEAMFSATCTLLHPAGNKDFGDKETYWPSKKAAKTMLAKEMVMHLRAIGEVPEKTPNNANGPSPPSSLSDPSAQDPFTSTNTSAPSPGPPNQNQNQTQIDINEHPDPPPATQLRNLCLLLRIPLPTYHSSQPEAPGFYSYHVTFPTEPELRGQLAGVERVFGKKRAKEECDKRVVAVLEEIKARRLAAAGLV